jgi:hypothetical protein
MRDAAKKTTAANISVRETLDLLDGPFKVVAEAVAKGRFALWLGSGISRERVDDLRVIVRRVLDYVSAEARNEDGDGPYKRALNKALNYALTAEEKQHVDMTAEPVQWPNVGTVVERLIGKYAQLLDLRIQGKTADHLVWEVVDVRGTYASDHLEPDCEHLAIAVLALEGVFPKIATANWDGLIEKAVASITNDSREFLTVFVRADDMRCASGRSSMHKFHGCAVRAKADEGRYREYVVGRQQQITDWPNDPKFALMKNLLEGISASLHTLMVGLSAQDSNIQNIFSVGRVLLKWPWPSNPPAYVFAEEELGADQGTMLKSVYKDDYDANQIAIENGAKIPAYGKSLLLALVLSVLWQKCSTLVGLASAPNLSRAERDKIVAGAIGVRNDIASKAENTSAGKRVFMHSLIAGLTRNLAIFRGDMDAATKKIYGTVGAVPVGQIANDPNLQMSGMPELAAFVGIIGLGQNGDGWAITQPVGGVEQGSVVVLSPASTIPRKVFVVSNNETLSKLVGDGIVDESDENTIVALCSAPLIRRQRNPLAIYGRDDATPSDREFSFKALVLEATSVDHLLARFKEEATL